MSENFLSQPNSLAKSSHEIINPYVGEIVDYPGTGKIVVVIGYHSLEKEWGKLVREQFKRNVADHGQKVHFLEVNSPVSTGEDSPALNAQIAECLRNSGEVEMVIDIHEHPESKATRVSNSWSLTTGNSEVSEKAKTAIRGLRVYPFDDYSRSRTGGKNIPYVISDPDLPQEAVDAALKGNISPEIQQALNDTMSLIVSISNIQLETSARGKEKKTNE